MAHRRATTLPRPFKCRGIRWSAGFSSVAYASATYWPRRPDFEDVACGFTIGALVLDAGAATLCSGAGRPGRLREKSGMFALPFFFIAAPPGVEEPNQALIGDDLDNARSRACRTGDATIRMSPPFGV